MFISDFWGSIGGGWRRTGGRDPRLLLLLWTVCWDIGACRWSRRDGERLGMGRRGLCFFGVCFCEGGEREGKEQGIT